MCTLQSISYKDVLNNIDVSSSIEKAFGKNGLGIILLKDFPNFQEERLALFHTIRKFANLPECVRNKYSRPDANYAVGWSHGKERMKKGTPDQRKGSYYVNSTELESTDDLKKKYPETYGDNVWPDEELPGLKSAYIKMMKLQLKVGGIMLKLLDSYLHVLTGEKHDKEKFYNMIAKSNNCTGRILHYFQNTNKNSMDDFDGLCGWHLDHGYLTVLLSPLYLDLQGERVKKPDNCGLHVKSPTGEVIAIDIPEDCFAIQTGEMLQVLSGGFLRATAHCVKPFLECLITREQFVLFLDSFPEQKIELPNYSLSYEEVIHTPHLPENVPKLENRLVNAETYRDFGSNSFKAYYA